MLKTKIYDLELDVPIFNASGVHCTTKQQLEELESSDASIILSKSITIKSREGNPKPRYFDNNLLSINSSGLPNLGFDYYNNLEFKKPYFLSLSGLSLDDNLYMIENLSKSIKGIELNLSCPNLINKSQIGYDFIKMEEYIRKISEILFFNKKLIFGIKLPPYFDNCQWGQVIDIVNNSNINSITCINSIGNGLVIDPIKESVVIKPKNGYGGIGGTIVKPIALANVHKFYKNTKCNIIGCGGINTGYDAFEFILAGASAIQIGTCLQQNGTNSFTKISNELIEIMKDKNYSTINEFKGKLKYL